MCIENLISGRSFILLFEFTDVAAPLSDIRICDFKSCIEEHEDVSSEKLLRRLFSSDRMGLLPLHDDTTLSLSPHSLMVHLIIMV